MKRKFLLLMAIIAVACWAPAAFATTFVLLRLRARELTGLPCPPQLYLSPTARAA